MRAGGQFELLPRCTAPVFSTSPLPPPPQSIAEGRGWGVLRSRQSGGRAVISGGALGRQRYHRSRAGEQRQPEAALLREKLNVRAGGCGPRCTGISGGQTAGGRCGCLGLEEAGLTLVPLA